jgi:hypothetical protein
MAHATWLDNQEGSNELRVSDVLKVLILYVQYLVVLGSAKVAWPTSLSAVFAAAALLFSSGTGQFISLDCIFSPVSVSIVPMPIAKQLIYLVLPVAILLGVIVVHLVVLSAARLRRYVIEGATSQCHGSIWSKLAARLPAIALVVLYSFFPSLLRVGLSMFACHYLDVAPSAPFNGENPVATATNGYWVYDMQQACWSGWHKAWALGLGMPCVLIFCLGVPLAILALLTANKGRLYDPGFRIHFGSLYRNFRPKRFYWEAVVTVQTIVLVCIAVFSNVIGAYYQMVVFAMVFSLSLLLQVWFRPFAFAKLHHLHLSAMGCLYITTFISLTFFDLMDHEEAALNVYRQAMGVVLMLVNVAFVCWAVHSLVALSKGPLGNAMAVVRRSRIVRALKRWVTALRGEERGESLDACAGGDDLEIEVTSLRAKQGGTLALESSVV